MSHVPMHWSWHVLPGIPLYACRYRAVRPQIWPCPVWGVTIAPPLVNHQPVVLHPVALIGVRSGSVWWDPVPDAGDGPDPRVGWSRRNPALVSTTVPESGWGSGLATPLHGVPGGRTGSILMVARTQPDPGPLTIPARPPTVIMTYGDRLLCSTLFPRCVYYTKPEQGGVRRWRSATSLAQRSLWTHEVYPCGCTHPAGSWSTD